MRVRSFKAASMPEAMALVRREMGEDAIIIASETLRGGVAVRAAVEGTAAPAGPAPGMEDDLEQRLLERLSDQAPDQAIDPAGIADCLAGHGVPPALASRLAVEAARPAAGPPEALAMALDAVFSFQPLPVAPRRPVMLVGPPGAGKTATAAKLAARATLAGESAQLVTCDVERAGGQAQLATFADVIGCPLTVAAAAPELAAACVPPPGTHRAIVIDTPGVNPFDAADIGALARLARLPGLEIVCVLPAGLDVADSADMARAFAALGATKLIATRLDVARRLGGILAAAEAGALALAHLSATPYIADGLAAVTPLRVARRLMRNATTAPEEIHP